MASVVTITTRLRDETRDGLASIGRGLNRLEHDAALSDKALSNLRGAAIGLAPALVPIAAQAAPIAAGMAAAGVAVGAFGAALAPQVKSLGDVAQAQQKAADASVKYGAGSKQAVQAQEQYRAELEALPPATQRAAVAFGNLKAAYAGWSDSLATDTLTPVTKSMAVLGALLPHLTPLVKGTSTELDRLVTIAGGAVSTPGFDRLADRFDTFANGIVKRAADEVVHFSRVLSEGAADGPISKLMQYAEQNGPQVEQTLKDLAIAVGHIGQAAADAGPGMLTVVDTLARLISAVPPEVLSRLVQLYTAFKLIKLTGVGVQAVVQPLGAVSRQLTAMNAASVAAGGGLTGLRAAFGSLSMGAKVGVTVAAIGALVLAMEKLSEGSRRAPDVERMTTAVGELGRTGQASGELIRTFGKDLDGLGYAIGRVSGKSSGMDKFNDVMNKVFSLGMAKSNSMKQAERDIDAIDKGLAQLVSSGHPEQAQAALEEFAKAGYKLPTKSLDDYQSALADAKFESQLAADAQGLFGQQALEVQKALDGQKRSADGLRESIQALNDVNRKGLSAESDFQQAIDDATAAIKGHRDALHIANGELDLGSQKARDAYKALGDLATATDADAAAARDAGKSWTTVNGIYEQGRSKLIATAKAMGLNTEQARKLADQILKVPDKTAVLRGNIQDLQAKVASARKQLASVKGPRAAVLRADISQLENVIRDAQAKINALHGAEIVIRSTYVSGTGNVFHEGGQYKAAGGLVSGPGTGTSDDVAVWASNGEFVVNAAATAKHRKLLEAINSGSMEGYAKGGHISKAQAAAEQQARAGLAGQFGISYFGQMAGYQATPFQRSTAGASSVDDLVSTLNDWRSKIAAATHGATESRLLGALSRFGSSMLKNEKALLSVNSQLDGARSKLASLKDSFAQLRDSVASSVVSFGSIAKQGTGQPGGAASVISQLQGDTATAKRFAADLAALKKKGLNSQSLAELAQAGIEGGGLENAERLLGASSGDIKQINDLEKQLQAAAKAAGTTTADAMYGGGIKAAEAMVKGLEKSQKRIEAVMAKAAEAMAAQLKKSLGIKGKASGGVIGAAASGGPRGSLTWVGEQGPELVNLPAGSMVHTAGDSRRMAAHAAGGGGRPVQVNLVVDGQTLARVLLDPQRELVRQLGGDVQHVYGRRF